MNMAQREIANKLRSEWDRYHDSVMPWHMTGLESAAKIVANAISASDPKFKKVDFLKIAIRQ